MNMLDLKKAADELERANGVRWYGYVLRQPRENIFMKAMVHKVDGKHKQGRSRMKWREQVEGNIRRIALRKEYVADQCRWKEGARKVAEVVGCFQPPPVTKDI